MAGGSGTRFWPLSRQHFPKQFLSLGADRSLIQQAYDRCQPWIPPARSWVVTGQHLATLTQEHLPDVPKQQILLEPAARNTAPCLGLAAICLMSADPEATMLAMPADHVIADEIRFREDVERAVALIDEDPQRLVLFGVPPTSPATGFGYIERGASIAQRAFHVAAFREKPDRTTAEQYLRAGTFFWNCGIFVWKAQRILDAIAACEPEMARKLNDLKPHVNNATWEEALAEIFPTLKSVSIDYAVLEREPQIIVLEARFPWDDVGGWEAVGRLIPPDSRGNSLIGETVVVNSNNCVVRTAEDHVIALLEITDCIVVHTDDATLVARRDDDESIRKIVAALQCPELEKYL